MMKEFFTILFIFLLINGIIAVEQKFHVNVRVIEAEKNISISQEELNRNLGFENLEMLNVKFNSNIIFYLFILIVLIIMFLLYKLIKKLKLKKNIKLLKKKSNRARFKKRK